MLKENILFGKSSLKFDHIFHYAVCISQSGETSKGEGHMQFQQTRDGDLSL